MMFKDKKFLNNNFINKFVLNDLIDDSKDNEKNVEFINDEESNEKNSKYIERNEYLCYTMLSSETSKLCCL